jgi:hypothetical protein
LVQIEQLHAVTIARSVVHSNRTWPQWHPPVNVLTSGMALLLSPSHGRYAFRQVCGADADLVRRLLRQLIDANALARRQRWRRGRLIAADAVVAVVTGGVVGRF